MPLTCDAARLAAEVETIKPHEWRAHPTGFAGNSAALLVTVGGGQNDDFAHAGQLAPTPLLHRLPYVRQIMAALDCPISRSRFMRLAPGQRVPMHDDVGWHWFDRIRVHVPVITHPGVRFHCGDRSVHMAAGEVWIFDNFARHGVDNDSDITRVHLVIDVVPTSAFFALAARGDAGPGPRAQAPTHLVPAEAQSHPVRCEVFDRRSPSRPRLEGLAADLTADLARLALPPAEQKAVRGELAGFVDTEADFDAFRASAKRLVRLLAPAFLEAGGDDPRASFGFLGGLSIGRTPGADAIRVLAEVEQRTIAEAEMGAGEILQALGPVHGPVWAARKAAWDEARGS
ncbi:MAG: aspartyl/asparaginyl beta-hydroxylase domain-containing protein [Myxococcales bacterium]|nr:aspartyl/asparaginyl beta-hydroxylase domain-containing protein [Myxococcales bacterium]